VIDYYSQRLSAARLKQVYDAAPPRVKQYLDAEVGHVLEKIRPGDYVIELGCGYGRVIQKLAGKAGWAAGVDTSLPTLAFAREFLGPLSNCSLFQMDAVRLGFQDRTFDCAVCIQNGISAFHVDQRTLISEAVRVSRAGGIALFSSYSDKFREERLKWFELQAKHGLVGDIDYDRTMNGVIVCKDGFTATTVDAEGFQVLTAGLKAQVRVVEVDGSSCSVRLRYHSD